MKALIASTVTLLSVLLVAKARADHFRYQKKSSGGATDEVAVNRSSAISPFIANGSRGVVNATYYVVNGTRGVTNSPD